MHDDNAGCEANATRRIHTRRDGLSLKFKSFVAGIDRMDVVVGDPAFGIGIAKTGEQ